MKTQGLIRIYEAMQHKECLHGAAVLTAVEELAIHGLNISWCAELLISNDVSTCNEDESSTVSRLRAACSNAAEETHAYARRQIGQHGTVNKSEYDPIYLRLYVGPCSIMSRCQMHDARPTCAYKLEAAGRL